MSIRVLGIDPGTFKMGVGVVDSNNYALTLVLADTLVAPKSQALPARLYKLYTGLNILINRIHPSVVAIEAPFVHKNVRTAMAVGQAQAIAMVAAAQHELETFSYAPSQVKRAVTDYGGSSKTQVHEMVRVQLGLPDEWTAYPDAADALAVAICHASANHVKDLLIQD